jgi:hypothetical protein
MTEGDERAEIDHSLRRPLSRKTFYTACKETRALLTNELKLDEAHEENPH